MEPHGIFKIDDVLAVFTHLLVSGRCRQGGVTG